MIVRISNLQMAVHIGGAGKAISDAIWRATKDHLTAPYSIERIPPTGDMESYRITALSQ